MVVDEESNDHFKRAGILNELKYKTPFEQNKEWSEGALDDDLYLRLRQKEIEDRSESTPRDSYDIVLVILNWIILTIFFCIDVPLLAWHKIPLLLG